MLGQARRARVVKMTPNLRILLPVEKQRRVRRHRWPQTHRGAILGPFWIERLYTTRQATTVDKCRAGACLRDAQIGSHKQFAERRIKCCVRACR